MPNLKSMQAAVVAAAGKGAGTGHSGKCLRELGNWLLCCGNQVVDPLRMADSRDDPTRRGGSSRGASSSLEAPAEWKRVEERFERTGRILHLHVGGEVIRTTPEHPFFVAGTGWTAAGALAEGDRIATLSGEWVAVEEILDTELYEPVYNLRVAEHHTYFVGDEHWRFAAWAHNTYEFLSGLKVTEELAGRINLTASDRSDIIYGIRNEGIYGGMGRRDVLVSFLAYELDPVSSQAYAAAALSEYLRLACVKTAREKEEKRIDAVDNKSKTIPGSSPQAGMKLRGWTAYIYTGSPNGLGNVDARNNSYETYIASFNGMKPKNPTHGHHIVYKDGQAGITRTAAQEGRDILLYYGINPYWGKENLAYAPNPGSHSGIEQVAFVAKLRDAFELPRRGGCDYPTSRG